MRNNWCDCRFVCKIIASNHFRIESLNLRKRLRLLRTYILLNTYPPTIDWQTDWLKMCFETQTQISMSWPERVMPWFFSPLDTPSWGCRDCICMQTLWAENLIISRSNIIRWTTQNSNKDALFLFFVMGTLPPLPAISPLLWCQWQLQTVCPENIKHHKETQTEKISTELDRKVTCSASFLALKF